MMKATVYVAVGGVGKVHVLDPWKVGLGGFKAWCGATPVVAKVTHVPLSSPEAAAELVGRLTCERCKRSRKVKKLLSYVRRVSEVEL